MNAVLALCKFCELHGPSVLFCTQAFHEMEDDSVTSYMQSKNSFLPKKQWYGPNYYNYILDSKSTAQRNGNCEGCKSLDSQCSGFICNDHEARVSYVSSHYPLNSDVFSIVRQACLRSLSCEVCPGQEGPIYYGDNVRGHVLSHTFFLKDRQARGLKSLFSIIIIMSDKIFLLNSWPFLVKHFQRLIADLQSKALKVFHSEQMETNLRSVKLNSVTQTSLDTFRRQRGNVKGRSIVNLTMDKNIFQYIHSWFTWILKAGACRINEKLIEGFHSEEENIVDLENEEEIEDGFVKVQFQKKKLNENIIPICLSDQKSEPDISDNEIKFKSIREVYKVLGMTKFHCLAYHTVVGNQIIVLSKCTSLRKSIMDCLKVLLPQGCFQPIYSSLKYEESWKCNFFGSTPDIEIPDHIKASECVMQINLKDTEIAPSVEDINVTIESPIQIPERCPQVLIEMERVITDMSFPAAAIDNFLFTQKQIWMNKVKLFFAYTRGKCRSIEDAEKILKVLKSQDCDIQLLKFWMTALGSRFKSQTLSSFTSQELCSSDCI